MQAPLSQAGTVLNAADQYTNGTVASAATAGKGMANSIKRGK